MIAAPVLGLGGLLAAALTLGRSALLALAATTLAITGYHRHGGPVALSFLLPSSLDPAVSLTVWSASSSHMTLFIMLVCT